MKAAASYVEYEPAETKTTRGQRIRHTLTRFRSAR
jgi:hypothetical protein